MPAETAPVTDAPARPSGTQPWVWTTSRALAAIMTFSALLWNIDFFEWLGFAFVHHFGIVLFEPGHYAVSTRVSMTAAAASVMGVALAIALVDCVILALANGIRRLTRPSTGPAEPTVS